LIVAYSSAPQSGMAPEPTGPEETDMQATPMRRSAAALLPALALWTAACSTNPATGGTQLSLISEAQEIEMGREADAAIVAQMGLYPDEALQRYVHQLGTRLAATSERPNLPWTFRVIDDHAVNAFALPGGFIYVTRGIMANLESEAQLATVLGHEIGHVTARHSVEQLSRQQLAQLGLGIGAILRPDLAGVIDLAGTGLGLLFLKYGRDDERQSDELGVRYMTRANFDPRVSPQVFVMLERASQVEGAGRVPEWLSTHPDPGNRAQHLTQLVSDLQAQGTNLSSFTVNAEEYVQRLDGLTFGPNPREGFFRDGVFWHPDLRFRITFPGGWQTQNTKQAVLAMSPQQDALMQLTLAQGSAAQAAQTFASQQGVQTSGVQRGDVNGLPAAALEFAANTQSGTVQGRAAWIEYGGNVYQIIGYGTQQRWGANQGAVVQSIQSFARVTDQSILSVQPLTLDVVRADRATSFQQFAQQNAGPIEVERLLLLNQAQPTDQIRAGELVKRVR
jgi:predicted Zn-dependent protease